MLRESICTFQGQLLLLVCDQLEKEFFDVVGLWFALEFCHPVGISVEHILSR